MAVIADDRTQDRNPRRRAAQPGPQRQKHGSQRNHHRHDRQPQHRPGDHARELQKEIRDIRQLGIEVAENLGERLDEEQVAEDHHRRHDAQQQGRIGEGQEHAAAEVLLTPGQRGELVEHDRQATAADARHDQPAEMGRQPRALGGDGRFQLLAPFQPRRQVAKHAGQPRPGDFIGQRRQAAFQRQAGLRQRGQPRR